MATESVATESDGIGRRADSPSEHRVTHQWRETSTFERIADRLDGLQAVATLASVAAEEGSLTNKVWLPLFDFIEAVADDIHRDAELLWRENGGSDHGN
jgi:hypothetical protein